MLLPFKYPVFCNHAKARSEALYSTGSVTIEKSAEVAIIAMPIQHTVALFVDAKIAMPATITQVAAVDAKFTMGTNCERRRKGA